MVRELEVIGKYDYGRSWDFLLYHLLGPFPFLLILTRSVCRAALKYASSWTFKTFCVKKGRRPPDPKLKSKKIRRANEAKAVADLEQAALQFVSCVSLRSVLLLINTVALCVGATIRPEGLCRPSDI